VEPAAAPLQEVVRHNGTLNWPEAREVLLALAGELVQAEQEGILPEQFSLSTVWALPDGQVLLLDMPGPGGKTTTPIDLLADVAVLLLEGSSSAWDLPCRPLPLHARELLADLPHFGGDLEDVAAFQQRLAATRERPAEVSRPVRLLHLAVLVAAQALCCAGWLPLAITGGFITLGRASELEQAEYIDSELQRASAAGGGAGAAAQEELQQQQAARERLRSAREPAERYYRARRAQLLPMRLGRKDLPGEERLRERKPLTRPLHEEADKMATSLESGMDAEGGVCLIVLFQSCIAFVICLISAAVFRGGLRYRMFGLCLVRYDGRPAKRLKCVWRMLAAWLLCIAPLVVARSVEELHWAVWMYDERYSLLALADLCWLVMAGMFVVTLAILLISPARSLHDRLAGTVLVPR
jgi:hypothetical protein